MLREVWTEEGGCFQSNAPYIKLFMTSMVDNGKWYKKNVLSCEKLERDLSVVPGENVRRTSGRMSCRVVLQLSEPTASLFIRKRRCLLRYCLLSLSIRTFMVFRSMCWTARYDNGLFKMSSRARFRSLHPTWKCLH